MCEPTDSYEIFLPMETYKDMWEPMLFYVAKKVYIGKAVKGCHWHWHQTKQGVSNSECHGFENPCGFLIRVHKGTGRGTNMCILAKPVPILRGYGSHGPCYDFKRSSTVVLSLDRLF